MLLGSRGSLGRCLVVWVAGSAALAAAGLVLRPAAAEAWGDRASLDRLPLDGALTDLAAVVLLTCAAWAWLALTVTVAEAARGATVVRRSSRPWLLPAGARRLVLAGCGVALTAGVAQPAMAGTGDWPAPRGVAALSGLPLPDRAAVPPHRHATTDSGTARLSTPTATTVPDATTGPARAARPRGRSIVVRPGDCLWSIAARDLPPDASDAAVAARWRAIYAANRSLIGPDPDVIGPGLRLSLPPLPRKDPS